MEEPVDCSILVPVYNEERHIAQSLQAMCTQDFAGTLELVLADGGSTDATRTIVAEMAARDPRIRVFDNPRRTVSSGLNTALRHARGTWIARMDAHTVYPSDYVRIGVQRLQRGDVRWVSGPQLPDGAGRVSRAVTLALQAPLGRGASRKWASLHDAAGPEYELDTGVFAGVWRRETLLEYGGWDERWAKNEDSEMAARFLARGERLICVPAMAARYAPRDTLRGLGTQYLGYGRYRARTARRHPASLRPSLLFPPALVLAGACAVAARGPVRTAGRAGGALYGAALVSAGVRSRRAAGSWPEAALVPLALATMHVSFGVGAMIGAARDGPPIAALASMLGVPALNARPGSADEPVYAPSLT
jgi:GT2 family glycosyltransferase